MRRKEDKMVSLKIEIDKIKKSTSFDLKKLEKKWDIDSAYHSSNMEGSQVSYKTFHKIAKNIR